ncbi:MAG: HAD family hydrolase [Caldilineaceae bacterium]
MPTWQAVIFDLDDTLYPERDYVLSGFHAVAQWGETHLQIPAARGFAHLQGLFDAGVRGDTFNRWLAHFGVIDKTTTPEEVNSFITRLVHIYRSHEPHLRAFPEVIALLPKLAQRYRLGLLSDGYLAVQQRKWAALSLTHFFHGVIFSDQWGRTAWKPSQQPFHAILTQLAVPPHATVYIGDNPLKDFWAPRHLGMRSIWLQHAQGDYSRQQPPTPEHAPHIIAPSWRELTELLLVIGD